MPAAVHYTSGICPEVVWPFSGVRIYAAMVDGGLNEQGFIVPGLGDAGDRSFGTVS